MVVDVQVHDSAELARTGESMAITGKIVISSHDWPESHWDMYVDFDALSEKLATWAIDAPPGMLESSGHAAKLADHRRVYLTFEGEVSDGRGTVAVVFEGEFTTENTAADKELTLQLRLKARSGETLEGDMTLYPKKIPVDPKTKKPVSATRNNWSWIWQPKRNIK